MAIGYAGCSLCYNLSNPASKRYPVDSLSIFALTLALAFTGPSRRKDRAGCAKAGGTWNATTKMCEEKKM
jgi:hypothetical protein